MKSIIPKNNLKKPEYRSDIDGLRAIAVLSVVFFHAFPNIFRGGFIGVDIFFVISGFLISRIIFENLDNDSFRFRDFYERRINRIFPALILVLLVCFIVGWFTLLADEFAQLGKHIFASSTFISNLILWREAGYFDISTETKPLLHLWSLGIEEQFYLLWPFLVWLAWKIKFNRVVLIVSLFLVSFFLNLKGVTQDGVGTFYSPITRFWELISGGALAYMTLYKNNLIIKYRCSIDQFLSSAGGMREIRANLAMSSNILSLFGLLLLIFGFSYINNSRYFPGIWALFPVCGTLIIILAGPDSWLNNKILSNKVIVWFGLISFPLYLWHWPIFSFIRIFNGELPNYFIRIIIVFLTIIFAAITFRFLELPLRKIRYVSAKACILISLMFIVGVAGFFAYQQDGLKFRNIVKANEFFTQHLGWKYWDDENCVNKYHISPCQASNSRLDIAIIGDSHANHLYPGLVNSLKSDIGIFQGGTCTPLLGIRIHVDRNQINHPCLNTDYLSKNLATIDANPSIKTIIISSFWRPMLDGNIINLRERQYWGGIMLESLVPVEKGLSADELVYRGLKRTIQELINRKLVVIFLRDTPDFKNDIRDECLKRFSLNASINCKLPRSVFESRRLMETRLIQKLIIDYPNLKIYDPFEIFCDDRDCFLVSNGLPLFRDQHHLSLEGSTRLGQAVSESFLYNMMR